jgi:cation transport ATPase
MKRSISDIFLTIGVLVGVATACYAAYFVWTMEWGTGSRNKGLGVAALVFSSMVAFGVSLVVFVLLGTYLESWLDKRGR